MNRIRTQSLVVLLALAAESIYSLKYIEANTHVTELWAFSAPTCILVFPLLFLFFTGKRSFFAAGVIVWSWVFLFVHLRWSIDHINGGVGWVIGYGLATLMNIAILVVLFVISAIVTKMGSSES